MIARLTIELPYRVAIPESADFKIVELPLDGMTAKVYPLGRTSKPNPSLTMLTVNDLPAFEADILRIDFSKQFFDRSRNAPLDPDEGTIRRVLTAIYGRLRHSTRSPRVSSILFPDCRWRLDYRNDDGSEFAPQEEFVRSRGVDSRRIDFLGLTPDVWDEMFLPGNRELPLWEEMFVDALNALPHVGTAVVLGAASLEIFIGDTLERLSGIQRAPYSRRSTNSPVEKKFDSMLKRLAGHSLKEDARLWEVFERLKSVRNAFIHEGVPHSGDATKPIDFRAALTLLDQARGIPDRIRSWLPEELRWTVSNLKNTVSMKNSTSLPPGE